MVKLYFYGYASPNAVSRASGGSSWLRASCNPSSDHYSKTFDVSEIGGIILLVAEAKADAKAKAADTKPTEYDKGCDRKEVDPQVTAQRNAGWCEAKAKAD